MQENQLFEFENENKATLKWYKKYGRERCTEDQLKTIDKWIALGGEKSSTSTKKSQTVIKEQIQDKLPVIEKMTEDQNQKEANTQSERKEDNIMAISLQIQSREKKAGVELNGRTRIVKEFFYVVDGKEIIVEEGTKPEVKVYNFKEKKLVNAPKGAYIRISSKNIPVLFDPNATRVDKQGKTIRGSFVQDTGLVVTFGTYRVNATVELLKQLGFEI